jgi:hypothetical protein
MGWGQGYESISDVNSRLEREGRQKQRQVKQDTEINYDLKNKLENISKEKEKFLDEIKNDPSNIENYETDMNEYGIILNTYNDIYSTTYEKNLERINQTEIIKDYLQQYFSKILDNRYKDQYKEYSKKNKMIHILITFFILCIIAYILIISKDKNYYLLLLCFPIIYIGYKSYNMFKRILEKKYTDKQDKREQILQNINNKYIESNKNNFIGNEEDTIRTIIKDTKYDIGT